MANHTFTTFRYDDESQKLADALFQFKKSKTYAVERMGLDDLNRNTDIAEFYAVANVETQYRKKKTDAWQSLDDFWSFENIMAKSCPHWQRTAVQLTVGMGIRGDTNETPIIQKLVTFQTWFDSKYKSQADAIANSILSNSYNETCQVVRAEWNDNALTDGQVDLNALKNGVGIMLVLAKHLEQEQEAQNQKTLDIFAKIKI
jgi:hypothetical protein